MCIFNRQFLIMPTEHSSLNIGMSIFTANFNRRLCHHLLIRADIDGLSPAAVIDFFVGHINTSCHTGQTLSAIFND